MAFNGGSPGGVPAPNFDINEGEALDEIIDPNPLELSLKTEDGYPIPEAYYRVIFEDGTTRSGILDKEGKSVIPNVPKDSLYEISYPDKDDVRAKTLAYQLNDAINQGDTERVLAILSEPRNDLLNAQRVFKKYLEKDLVETVMSTTSEDNKLTVHYLLTHAELLDDEGLEYSPTSNQ